MRFPPSLFLLAIATTVVATSASPVRAQLDVAPAAPAAEREVIAPEARWAERLLTLRGGAVLRGECRLDLDHAQGQGQWLRRDARDRSPLEALPAGAVIAARSVADALHEWTTRRHAERLARGGQRVPLVAWALGTGLLVEALAELDRALEEEPDSREVLQLLSRPDLPIGLPAHDADDPASLIELARYGAGAPPALQELVVIALGRAGLRQLRELMPELERGLQDRRDSARRFAALALRRLLPGVAAWPLTLAAVVDRSAEVRAQAALALRDAGDESAIEPLARALESRHALVRTQAAEALGRAGFVAAVEPLALRLSTLRADGQSGGLAPSGHVFIGRQISYVQGFDAEVATNAAIANPSIGTLQAGATLDATVFGVSQVPGVSFQRESATLRAALRRLTGLALRDTNATWTAWWKSAGASWLAERLAPPGAASTAAGR